MSTSGDVAARETTTSPEEVARQRESQTVASVAAFASTLAVLPALLGSSGPNHIRNCVDGFLGPRLCSDTSAPFPDKMPRQAIVPHSGRAEADRWEFLLLTMEVVSCAKRCRQAFNDNPEMTQERTIVSDALQAFADVLEASEPETYED